MALARDTVHVNGGARDETQTRARVVWTQLKDNMRPVTQPVNH
jgi:hypothetical protein